MKQAHQNFKDFLENLGYPKVEFWRKYLKDGNKGISIGYSTFILWSRLDCKPSASNLQLLSEITEIPENELFKAHE